MNLSLDAWPLVEACLAGGGEFSELFQEESRGLSVVMDDGQVEKVIAGVDCGAGLRLIHGLRTFYAHTNDVSPGGLMPLAKNLAGMAGGEPGGLSRPFVQNPGLKLEVAVPPGGVETARKVDLVRAAEAAARAVDPRIKQVRVNYLDRVQHIKVTNSFGAEAEDRRTYVVLIVHCVAEENGLTQTGYEVIGGLLGMELFRARIA